MTRSIGVAVVTVFAVLAIGLVFGLSSAPPAAAAITDVDMPTPPPIFSFLNPIAIGVHVIDAMAEGIANLVEFIGTPPPVAIPAPHAVS